MEDSKPPAMPPIKRAPGTMLKTTKGYTYWVTNAYKTRIPWRNGRHPGRKCIWTSMALFAAPCSHSFSPLVGYFSLKRSNSSGTENQKPRYWLLIRLSQSNRRCNNSPLIGGEVEGTDGTSMKASTIGKRKAYLRLQTTQLKEGMVGRRLLTLSHTSVSFQVVGGW